MTYPSLCAHLNSLVLQDIFASVMERMEEAALTARWVLPHFFFLLFFFPAFTTNGLKEVTWRTMVNGVITNGQARQARSTSSCYPLQRMQQLGKSSWKWGNSFFPYFPRENREWIASQGNHFPILGRECRLSLHNTQHCQDFARELIANTSPHITNRLRKSQTSSSLTIPTKHPHQHATTATQVSKHSTMNFLKLTVNFLKLTCRSNDQVASLPVKPFFPLIHRQGGLRVCVKYANKAPAPQWKKKKKS